MDTTKMNAGQPFLTFTPQLVSLFGHLWDNQRETDSDFLLLVGTPFKELCENMVAAGPYQFGDIIDGLHGHQLVVVMDILNQSKFSHLSDFCCLRESECENSNGHPALQVSSISNEIALELYQKAFGQLLEDGGTVSEEKMQAVERKFDSLYVSFDSLIQNCNEITS